MDTDVEDPIYSIELVVEDLKHRPHTYESILGDNTNKTKEFILRRKLNNLCKQGIVCKSVIPGTRFGKCIFFVLPKKYSILVESSRTGSQVFFFENYKKIDKIHIKVEDYFLLDGNRWLKKSGKIFNEGSILSFF